MSTEAHHYDEKYKVEEWNRSIPQAGYIKLGALRYGIRLSKLNSISTNGNKINSEIVDSQSANKQQITLPISTSTSLIMSPSSDNTASAVTSSQAAAAAAAAANGKSDFCNDTCCCCYVSSSSSSSSSNAFASKNISRNSQLSAMSAKNRTTSSPSSASSSSSSQKLLLQKQQQQQNQQQQQQRKSEQLKISSSVSSSNFKREASPTVCCYYIHNRSQNSQRSDLQKRSNNNNNNNIVDEKVNNCENKVVNKIKNFERRNLIKNSKISEVVATAISSSSSSSSSVADVDRRPVYECISENNNNNNNNNDDKNSNFSTFHINQQQQQQQLKATTAIPRGESQKFTAQSEKCKLKYVNDSNNNQVKSEYNSSLQQLSSNDKLQINTTNSDDLKITRVVIRHLEPITAAVTNNNKNNNNNFLNDNDFSFIDSSSQSVSRSSSASFASENGCDERNLRKLRIPKISSSRINSVKTSSSLSSANHNNNYNNNNIYSSSVVENRISNNNNNNNFCKEENEQQHLSAVFDQSIIPDNSLTMEKNRRNTLQKFGFGRKQTSSSASSSPDRKPSSSKTERLKELTEKLKGHKTGSFKLTSSRSVSPPPHLSAPVPPPRKFKRNSQDTSAASSTDNLDNTAILEHQPDLKHIGKSKSVEPSSLLSGQITRQLARFLRPNTSASNLESLNRSNEKVTRDDDFKLSKQSTVGSYLQRNIPFRSASFSQADAKSGKYIKSDLAALKASIRHPSMERSPSPPLMMRDLSPERFPLKSELSIQLEPDDDEPSSKRNSDIETIAEEPMAERLAEQHSIEDQLNVVQALETLIEEEPPLISVSPKTQRSEQLQQATTCLIPIPVFECVEKEWIPLPEHGGEEFCHPISEDVLPQAKAIENFIEIRLNNDDNKPHHHIIPEVELNNVALQLDEITEKLMEEITPPEEVCNVVKTQIPQSKEELVPQKSFESVEEIRISPEIQEVLETVAETLNEEHKFLTNAVGNANINIVNLICPDLELSSSDRGTPDGSKFDLLKTMESSPEPGSFDKSSFDKSDNEFPELTVRKRHSNDGNSGSDKSSPNASPNYNNDDKRKLDKSRRRKGIYIQWPAIERSQDTSFEYSANEDVYAPTKQKSLPNDANKKKSHGLGFNFSEPTITRQSESMCSEPYTPDSEHSMVKQPMWPKSSRRKSLTYQSSDERDDVNVSLSAPIKVFQNAFPRSESISDNESDRGSSRDRINSSPARGNEQDLKRYSKRPLRGPYGQMLEAEMKKPTKVHYDGILEELCRSDSIKKSNCSLDSTHSSSVGGFFSRSPKYRKGGQSLPVPMHTRSGSSPVPLIETPSPDPLPINHKKYPSSMDHHRMDSSDHISYKSDSGSSKKLSLDSHLSVDSKSPKRTSSDISDKHLKKNYGEKMVQKRSFDEIRVSTTPSEKSFVLNTPETPKNMAATPELLAELLKGSSEKILNEQTTQNKKHQMRNSGSNSSSNSSSGMGLPLAVLNSLNNLDTRTHVVVELFNTEKSYVESLQTIVLKYLNPLKLPENSGIVDVQTVDEIFFMVPSILNIHERYLEELRKRLDAWEPMQCIGDVYYDVFSKPIVLETYIAFVNNWNKAKDAIRTTKSTKPAFAKFLEAMAREHKGKLSLDNLLIKPVQKFPNYELIFQRLIKHTDSDHPDLSGCQNALKLVHDILIQLNCKEREALENGQREATLRELENVIEGISDLVSSDRSFVSFELVSMPSGQVGRKERGFFLFTDLLVITSIKKRSGTYRKPNSMPGSFSSTLDTNKYKFLTKIPLDDLEIVKSKDENVRRIMKEIEQLIEDSNKLQQILEITSSLRCPHQILEETIRDLQLNVQRQLAERQANDSQLNVLELNLNGPSGTQNMSIVFSKPDKRTQWEETFTETKQKLIASIERFQIPEFIASVPIRKTRAGLQFTCAAATLGTQKDVWVCNSDGYVGQVCVLSLNQADNQPTVTSCNGVCNARILCVTSVPSNLIECNNNNNSSINDDQNRSSLLSISNSSTISNKTVSAKSTASSTQSDNIQLDSSSSSSDSEAEANNTIATTIVQERSVSPSIISNTSQQSQPQQQSSCDDSESQMWLGTEDGFIHVYNCTDNIRIKKNKIKIQHVSAVYSILYLDKRVFVSLANGDICVYSRKDYGWNTTNPLVLSIGSSATCPVTKLLNVYGKLWCAIANCVKILNTSTLQIENNVEISSEAKPISNMTLLNQHVWISLQNSATILCCNVNNLKTICEVNLAPAVNKMLSNCDNIIQQHKAACLRVTSLLACKDIIWVGTSAGVLLTILAQNVGSKSTPVVTGIPYGHTGHVRFLTSIELDDNDAILAASTKRNSKSSETPNNNNNINNNNNNNNSGHMLIISGGDGFEDFRTTGTSTMNEIAGREDSTNHLLLWQQT